MDARTFPTKSVPHSHCRTGARKREWRDGPQPQDLRTHHGSPRRANGPRDQDSPLASDEHIEQLFPEVPTDDQSSVLSQQVRTIPTSRMVRLLKALTLSPDLCASTQATQQTYNILSYYCARTPFYSFSYMWTSAHVCG